MTARFKKYPFKPEEWCCDGASPGGGEVPSGAVVSADYSSANREFGGSSLTVSTDGALLRVIAYPSPRFTQPSVQEIVHEGWGAAHCSEVLDD